LAVKAPTPMQALAQIADGSGLSKADMQDLAAWSYNTHHATIADMAKRLEAAERDAARLKALEQAIEQWGNHPATKYKDSELWIRQRADALLREWTEGVG